MCRKICIAILIFLTTLLVSPVIAGELSDIVKPPTSDYAYVGELKELSFGAKFSDSTQSVAIILLNYTVGAWEYKGFEAHMDSINVTSQFTETHDQTAGRIMINCSSISPANGTLNIRVKFKAKVKGYFEFEWKYVYIVFQPLPNMPYMVYASGWTIVEVMEYIFFTISFYAGWNLIGIPLQPQNSSIDAIFGENLKYVKSIFAYHKDTWYFWIPGIPSTITGMYPGYGYWVEVTQPFNLTVCGTIAKEMPPTPKG